ncbi:MAG TPA: VWA domain-containing protein, partial [Fimbriimonadaceae bacterium]|nr:VWA domain-containing protein [Fimbriimonadaceae bacterium]
MSFSATGALLWLIPTGLILFALYLLKMRRKPFEVPATFLWPAQTEEIRANAFFQRPRLNILFWLQLLALVVIAAALAGPQFLTRSLAGRVTMIVLDGSASMRATDVSPSRFEVALDLARQAIGEVKAGDRIGVIFSGAQTEVAIPLTDAPGQHSSKLSELKAQDVSGNMPEALRLAAASVSAYDGARILVISDGAFRPIEQFSLPKGEVVFRSVGRSSRNLGISA